MYLGICYVRRQTPALRRPTQIVISSCIISFIMIIIIIISSSSMYNLL